MEAQVLDRFAIASSGGFFESKEGSLSFTIGEVAIQSIFHPKIILFEGFQQPDYVVTKDFSGSSESMHVFPNPASEKLFVSFYGKSVNSNVFISLYNSYGELMLQKKFFSEDGQLNNELEINSLQEGLYFLELSTISPLGKIEKSVSKVIIFKN